MTQVCRTTSEPSKYKGPNVSLQTSTDNQNSNFSNHSNQNSGYTNQPRNDYDRRHETFSEGNNIQNRKNETNNDPRYQKS